MVTDDVRRIARLVDELTTGIGERRYRTWFDKRVQLRLDGSQALEVTVGSPLERDCLQEQFSADLQQACLRAGVGSRRVVFRVDAPEPSAGVPRPMPREATVGPPCPEPTSPELAAEGAATAGFDRFVAGRGNVAALEVARQIATGQRVASPLLFWGPTGVGKTHLLHAIRDESRRRSRRARVVYLTAEQFTTGFVEAVHGRGLPGFRSKHRGVDVLLLDDLQFFLGKKKTVEELQYTLDTLLSNGAQVILACDRSPAELRGLGSELASRLGAGVSVGIQSADQETRRQILQQLAKRDGAELNQHVAEVIAAGVTGGARELGGVLNRLRVANDLLGEPMDEKAARKIVDESNRQTTPRLKLSDIQGAVCRVFGVDRQTLRSNKRTKSTTEPRMVAMWLSRKYTQAAWSEIGEYYGRRSHSTVISACRRVEKLINRSSSDCASGVSHHLHDALRQIEVELRTA